MPGRRLYFRFHSDAHNGENAFVSSTWHAVAQEARQDVRASNALSLGLGLIVPCVNSRQLVVHTVA